MRFAVWLMRFKGRPLPRDVLANRAPRVGELRVHDLRDVARRRDIRVARVLAIEAREPPQVLCELLEPSMIAMSPQAFTLSGFETCEDATYAQSWLVRWPDQRGAGVGAGAAFRPVTRIVVPDRG